MPLVILARPVQAQRLLIQDDHLVRAAETAVDLSQIVESSRLTVPVLRQAMQGQSFLCCEFRP